MWTTGGIYDRWVSFLERWRTGELVDPADLPRLDSRDFTGDTWLRLTGHLTAALSQRLQSWADALTMALGGAGDDFAVARTLHHARGGLQAIRAVAAHPALPSDLSAGLLDAVDTQVRFAQRSLEAAVEHMRRAGADRGDVERRLRTVRENDLTLPVGAGAGPVGAAAWATDPSAAPRRRVILD